MDNGENNRRQTSGPLWFWPEPHIREGRAQQRRAPLTEERIKEPQVCELASRVRVEIDPEMEAVYPRLYTGKVTVVTKEGRRITKRVDYPKGAPENPLSKEDIERKFLSLAGAAIGRAQCKSLLVEVNRALDAETIAPLAGRLGRCHVTGRL